MNCFENVDVFLFVNIYKTSHTIVSYSQSNDSIIPKEHEKNMSIRYLFYSEEIILISQISLDEYFVNPGILISIESLPSERNSSGFKNGKDNFDLTICLGYVTYDAFFTCFINVIVLCIIKTRIGKAINKLLAMVLMDNLDALDSENIG